MTLRTTALIFCPCDDAWCLKHRLSIIDSNEVTQCCTELEFKTSNFSSLMWRFSLMSLAQECNCLLSENKARPLCERVESAGELEPLHLSEHTHIQQIHMLCTLVTLCGCVRFSTVTVWCCRR